jgi:hypothetical protein
MEFPKRFHVKIASKQDFDYVLALLHKEGYRWFHGNFLDSPGVAARTWNNMSDMSSFYISGAINSREEKVVIVSNFPRDPSVDITNLIFKPVSPEQVLVIFLKHHRKFTSFKAYLKNCRSIYYQTGANFPLKHVFDDTDPRAFNYLKESFLELLHKFNLQDCHIDLVTILKMR